MPKSRLSDLPLAAQRAGGKRLGLPASVHTTALAKFVCCKIQNNHNLRRRYITCVGVPRTKSSTTNWLAKRNDNELSSERPGQPSWPRQGVAAVARMPAHTGQSGTTLYTKRPFWQPVGDDERNERHETRYTRHSAQV